jgi:hypothetical protein
MDWTALTSFLIFLLGMTLLVIQNIKYYFATKTLIRDNAQLILDKSELLKKISQILDQQDSGKIEETTGFVRFISESRDWAFQYIEDVQQAIQELSETPRSDRVAYAKAYKKVISFLPEATIES